MRLKHITNMSHGFSRHKGWFGFVYRDAHGKKIREKSVLTRIRSLGIPPAYTNVWICPVANGHIQATALDARGRTQYIYHPDWITKHTDEKFHRMLPFAHALPRMRRKVAHDLGLNGMPKTKVLAAIVRLLDTTFIRIGNEEYAKENDSFGLTTLRDRHVKGTGEDMRLMFKGKDGVVHDVHMEDERIRAIIAKCHAMAGKTLFAYIDPDGALQSIHSDDVNAYLAESSGEDITAKDFRTWHGTVIAAEYLWHRKPAQTKRDVQHDVKTATQRAADALGNTPAVCKKSYIHPHVLSSYAEGNFPWHAPTAALKARFPLLHVEEVAFMEWLKRTK
ncbi:MAG: DNA topoisomerase IB [Patescibacteria group bacterium]